MSVRVMSLAFYVGDLTLAQKAVLVALADHANDDGGSVYPSVDLIAQKVSASPRTVQRALRALEEQGLLEVVATAGDLHKATTYQLNVAEMERRKEPRCTLRPSRGDSLSPRGDSVTPRGDSVTPRGDSLSPRGDFVSDRDDSVTPDPSLTINDPSGEPSGEPSPTTIIPEEAAGGAPAKAAPTTFNELKLWCKEQGWKLLRSDEEELMDLWRKYGGRRVQDALCLTAELDTAKYPIRYTADILQQWATVDGLYELTLWYLANVGELSAGDAIKLADLVGDYPLEWIRAAIREAVIYGADKLIDYAASILARWHEEGRPDDSGRRDAQYDLRGQIPDNYRGIVKA